MSRRALGRIAAREIQPSTIHESSRNYAPLQREGLIPDGDDPA